MVVVLHNIRSIHNVGSIFRTADAVGCEKVYLSGITPAPLDKWGRVNTALVKVALGAEKYLPWEHVASTIALLKRLKNDGRIILAVEQSFKAKSLFKIKLSSKQWTKAVLIMGNEIAGLSPAILRLANTVIEIPMFGKKESLNVAVAFGIAAYNLRRQ